jgi:hypothetical protein
MVGVAVSQTVYFVEVYRLVGVSRDHVLATYGLDADDMSALPRAAASDPNRFYRKACTSFAECYASLKDTASIVRFDGEWRGAFWRSKDDAIFQAGVTPAVVAALVGVSHPVFWLSRDFVPYRDRRELTDRLNEHSARIGEYLLEAVGAKVDDVDALTVETATSGRAFLTSLRQDRDRFQLTYETDGPTILNAAVTYDPHWVARANGRRVVVVRGNFNGLAVSLPPGRGMVELAFESWPSRMLFGSRYVVLLLSVAVTGSVMLTVLRRPESS